MRKIFSWLKWTFIAQMVIYGVVELLTINTLNLYNQYLESGADFAYEEYLSANETSNSLGGFAALPLLVGFVLLIIWTNKAYRVSSQAPIFQSQRKYTKGWATGAWFIPVGNLFVPKRVISEIEQILMPEDPDVSQRTRWQDRDKHVSGTIWWGLFVTANLADRIWSSINRSASSDGTLTTSSYQQMMIVGILSNLATIVSLYFGIKYLGRITKNAELLESNTP
jgi:hypothetical protein